MTKNIFSVLLFLLISKFSFSQIGSGYGLSLESLNIQDFTGIQSFAVGQHNGEWLLIGGRIDGLHRRQPFASFDAANNNINLIVVNPHTQQRWVAPLSSLSTPLQEQLQSTNIQFLQRGNMLYAIGGYGYSATAGDHITYNKLTAIEVDSVIWAIKNGTAIAPYFRQIEDNLFTLTGAQMGRIGNTFYLVGGQNFVGRYNPMGPTHGPGFFQQYSNQIRKFEIQDNGTTLNIANQNVTTDTINLHRRDYNMLPQIFAGNTQGFTAFSGVFQYNIDLPYLNTVDILPASYNVNNTFTQYFNHYHCAKVALFDSVNQVMDNIFFGGISQYLDSAGVLVQDNNVPFTPTIAKVSRNNITGNMTETKIAEMPDLLGAGAEFIPNHALQMYENEIIKTHLFTGDSILLGYIVGGIQSSQGNIFFINTGIESEAHSTVYKVWLTRNANAIHQPLAQHSAISQLQVLPNPSRGKFELHYYNSKPVSYTLSIFDGNGKLLKEKNINNKKTGNQAEVIDFEASAGVYFLNIKIGNQVLSRKIVVE